MSNTCNVVVLISGSGSNLQALLDNQDEHNPARVCAVVSNRADAYGLVRARQAGVATECIDHREFDGREAFDAHLISIIDRYQPDLVVLAGFMRILSAGFVRHYTGRLLNIHPSLLPKYKGLHTHQRALEAGDSEHGCSVHFVSEELDGGPIIAQAKVAILPNDDANTLAQRVHEQEHLIYPQVVRWFAEQRLHLTADGAMLDAKQLPPTGITVTA